MNVESSLGAESVEPLSTESVRSLEPFFITPDTDFLVIPLDEGRSTVAKRLPVAYRADAVRKEHFMREQNYLTALEHHGIAAPQLVALPGSEIIQMFAPKKYITVKQLLEACERLEKHLPLDIAVSIILAITDAVSHIETRAARDNQEELDIVLHPDTLLIDAAGKTALTNIGFGNPPYLTSSILGTGSTGYFVYAAPEQCVAGRYPDARACYYTLGMVCYELLTGQPLFSSSTVRDLDAVSRRKIRRLHPLASDVDATLKCVDDLILRLLEPVPEERETDLEAVIRELAAIPVQQRSGETDLSLFLTQLYKEESDAMQYPGDGMKQMSATTDISEYNAS